MSNFKRYLETVQTGRSYYSENFFVSIFNRLRNRFSDNKQALNNKVLNLLQPCSKEVLAKINNILMSDMQEERKLRELESIMSQYPDQFNISDGVMEGMDGFEKKVIAAGAAAILALSILIGGMVYYSAEEEKEFKSYEQRGDVKEIGRSVSDQMAMTNKGKPSYTGLAPAGEYIVSPAHKHYYKVYKYGPSMEKTYKKLITQQEYEQLSLPEQQ